MPQNSQGLGTVRPTGVSLEWEKPEGSWPAIIKRMYTRVATESVADYFTQFDADMTWLAFDELANYKKSRIEPNAAFLREILSRFDGSALTLRGRIAASITLGEQGEQAVSSQAILELADRLHAGVGNGAVYEDPPEPEDELDDEDEDLDVVEAEVVDE